MHAGDERIHRRHKFVGRRRQERGVVLQAERPLPRDRRKDFGDQLVLAVAMLHIRLLGMG